MVTLVTKAEPNTFSLCGVCAMIGCTVLFMCIYYDKDDEDDYIGYDSECDTKCNQGFFGYDSSQDY